MIKIKANNFSGVFKPNSSLTASGIFKGYAWYFQAKASSWFIEIADQVDIVPEDLPLVGFGCSGWLNQVDTTNQVFDTLLLADDAGNFIENCLQQTFLLFEQKQLKYLPAVSCSCSDVN